MKNENVLHKGFTANGEVLFDNGLNQLSEEDLSSSLAQEETALTIINDNKEALAVHRDCTILRWNGDFQKPNINIIDGKFSFMYKHNNVTKIQLRSVPGGGIRYYNSLGTYCVPNGEYILSLWGSTYGYDQISACVEYNI
jgi:hypothetical protein